MKTNLINISHRNQKDCSDETEALTWEIKNLLRDFQNEKLPDETREYAYNRIIELTKQLTD